MNVIIFLHSLFSPPRIRPYHLPSARSFGVNQAYKNYFKECLNPSSPMPISTARRMATISVLGTMIVLSYLIFPLALLLKKYGYRFIYLNMHQISGAPYLDFYIRDHAVSGTITKRVFLLGHCKMGNKYIYNLYRNYITFIDNLALKILAYPFFISSVIGENISFKYCPTNYTRPLASDVWNKSFGKGKKPLVQMPPQDIHKCQTLLHKVFPQKRPFISLHVREPGFYPNDHSHNHRNADIFTYQKGIHFLIEKGYSVIRIGDSKMNNIEALIKQCNGMLFDYAHSNIKSEMMDIYLLSHCAFLIGCNSGPSTIPNLFGVNKIALNYINASSTIHFMKGDITTLKTFKYIKDNKLLPFEKLLNHPFIFTDPTKAQLDKAGIYVEDNTEEEILDTIKEFLVNKDGTRSELQKKSNDYITTKNYTFGLQGNFSNTTLKKYFNPHRVNFNYCL